MLTEYRSPIVVLPTYNEAENIGSTLTGILGCMPDVEVLVVDDNSPDGTGELAEGFAAGAPRRVHVLHRSQKGGLGTAYCAGFAWAMAHGYVVIAQMDADGSHPVERLPEMIARVAAGSVDVVVGSRYVKGGATANWPLQRRVLSRLANRYARTLLGIPQRDVTGAFRVWDARALQLTDPATLTASGYCFLVEMIDRAHRLRLRIDELPITFVDRVKGSSKMDRAVAAEGLVCVWRLRCGPRPLAAEPATALAA